MDPWAEWYSGSMAPPMRLPNGSLQAAPNTLDPMSVEQMYEGIYGPSKSGLTTRPVSTVAINPTTGMPYPQLPSTFPSRPSVVANNNFRQNEVKVPGEPVKGNGYMAGYMPPDSYRLLPGQPGMPSQARDTPAVAAIEQAAKPVYRATFHPALTFPQQAPEVLDLAFEPRTQESAQGFADSRGKPIRTPSGKVYTPKGYSAPSGAVSAPLKQDTRGPLSRVLGLKTSGLGGLLGGLFGMGGSQQQHGGNGLASFLAGALAQHPITTPAYNPNWATQAVSGSPFWATEGNSNGYSDPKGGALA